MKTFEEVKPELTTELKNQMGQQQVQSTLDSATASEWTIKTTGRRFAAATSATTIRAGVHEGKSWHHIIDPRTLLPAQSDTNLATVYCQSAVRADVLASCAIILGSSKAVPFLKRQFIEAAYLQGSDDTAKIIRKKFGKALQPIVTNKPSEVNLYV